MKWLLIELLFGNEPWPRKLPKKLREDLVEHFHLYPSLVSGLRYVRRLGTFAGRDVRYVRVFDPALVRDDPMDVRHYEQAHDAFVLFEGYLESDGTPRLKDMRRSVAGLS